MTEQADTLPIPAAARGGTSWGRLLQGVAVAHATVGTIVHREALAGIVRGRVVNQVPEQGEAATAFWFLVAAPSLWMGGRLLRAAEEHGDLAAQRSAGRLLTGVGAVGSAASPVSGFWAVAALGAAVWRAGSRERLRSQR